MTLVDATVAFLKDLEKHESLSVYKAAKYCGVADWPSFEASVRGQIHGVEVSSRQPGSSMIQAIGDAIGVAMLLGAHLERLGLMRRVT